MLTAGLVAAVADDGPTITLQRGQDEQVIALEVLGLPPREIATFEKMEARARQQNLQVRVEGGDAPPIFGTVSVHDDRLRFTPRFPLAHNLPIEVLYRPSRDSADDDRPLRLRARTPPRPPHPPTELLQIFPTADALPENLLRFYLEFSAPMSRGEAYRRIHLLDSTGQELAGVFLELNEELWDRSMTRFTLLLDPGRVKRGLVPRDELGPVLEAGNEYTLVIDKEWSDAKGQNLLRRGIKRFRTVPARNSSVDIREWKLEAPPAASRQPLVVTFPFPLDHALLLRMLTVETLRGEAFPGKVSVLANETYWRFIPERPWESDAYILYVNNLLEDVAGNSLSRAFDVDQTQPQEPVAGFRASVIPFTVK